MAAIHEAAFLQLQGEFAAAETMLRAISGEPAASFARQQLDMLYRAQGRWDDALAVVREHAQTHPNNPQIQHQLATALLARGDYVDGWRLYENRRQIGLAGIPANLPLPAWEGESVSRLLVVDEQGIGDTIQFARFLPGLVSSGIEVVVYCRPALVGLIASLGVHVVSKRDPAPVADAWVPIGSLPLHLSATLDSLPPPAAVAPSPEHRLEWASRLPAAAKIGVVTRGSSTHPRDAQRSLTPEAAVVVQTLPGSVSLEETSPLRLATLSDTAAVIERLPLIVTVDTSIAHLAGSLGKPCWVLLPFDCDWRWGRSGSTTPWYPSVRLFRQPTPGDWASVLDDVRRALGIGS